MSAVEKIKQKGFYIWQDERKREPRKDCQGKSCPLYDDRGYFMHCGHFFGGWCNHSKYGVPHDRQLVEVSKVLKILEDETQFLSEQGLLEYLASLEHKQWSHWTLDFLEFDNPSNREHWKRQAHSPYNQLTEKEKESDREWARKVLAIVKVQFLFEKLRWQEAQQQKLRELADLLENKPEKIFEAMGDVNGQYDSVAIDEWFEIYEKKLGELTEVSKR